MESLSTPLQMPRLPAAIHHARSKRRRGNDSRRRMMAPPPAPAAKPRSPARRRLLSGTRCPRWYAEPLEIDSPSRWKARAPSETPPPRLPDRPFFGAQSRAPDTQPGSWDPEESPAAALAPPLVGAFG